MKSRNIKLLYVRTLSTVLIFSMLMGLFFITINTNSVQTALYGNDEIIYNGNRNSNKVSLMINVYWGNEYLPQILEIFKKYNVKTTFFVGGSWVEKNEDLLYNIYNDGHEIGNHGYFHLDQDKLTYQQNKEEIYNNHSLIKVFLNYEMNLFAPPSGAFNSQTVEACNNLGYSVIMWSKDTIDWRDQNSSLIYSRATVNLIGGDLILMHPTEATVIALPAILEYIKVNNLIATTVSDTLI